MTATDEYFNLERPEADQFLFSTPNKTAAGLGAIVTIALIGFLVWINSGPASMMHSAKGVEKLGLIALALVLLLVAGWNFYIAIAGRSFLIDGKTKLVAKNGDRLTSFAGVRSVDLAVGYHPSINFARRTYALSLRMKSGESLAIDGLNWSSWKDLFMSDADDEMNNEDAAAHLDEIADEMAALIGVPVSKGSR